LLRSSRASLTDVNLLTFHRRDLRSLDRIGLSGSCRMRIRNSTGGFYEIPDDDPGGLDANRHSERDFAFG
jgi:hypothetical protein